MSLAPYPKTSLLCLDYVASLPIYSEHSPLQPATVPEFPSIKPLIWVKAMFYEDVSKWERSPTNTWAPSDTHKYICMELSVRLAGCHLGSMDLKKMKHQRSLEEVGHGVLPGRRTRMWQYSVRKIRALGSGSSSHLGCLKKGLEALQKTTFTHYIFF